MASRLIASSYQVFHIVNKFSTVSSKYSSQLHRNKKYTNLLSAQNVINCFVSNMSSIKTVNFEDVKMLKDKKDAFLIDVREPQELKETGILPGSINIPLADVENALKTLTNDEFLKRYGRSKPNPNSPLVFSCRSGKRSEKASENAVKLGYKDVRNYSGGWLDWEKHANK